MRLALEQDSARSGTLGVRDYEIPKKRQGLWIIGEFFFVGEGGRVKITPGEWILRVYSGYSPEF